MKKLNKIPLMASSKFNSSFTDGWESFERESGFSQLKKDHTLRFNTLNEQLEFCSKVGPLNWFPFTITELYHFHCLHGERFYQLSFADVYHRMMMDRQYHYDPVKEYLEQNLYSAFPSLLGGKVYGPVISKVNKWLTELCFSLLNQNHVNNYMLLLTGNEQEAVQFVHKIIPKALHPNIQFALEGVTPYSRNSLLTVVDNLVSLEYFRRQDSQNIHRREFLNEALIPGTGNYVAIANDPVFTEYVSRHFELVSVKPEDYSRLYDNGDFLFANAMATARSYVD